MKPASSTEYRHPREGGCNPIDRLQLVSRKPERFSEHLWCRLRKRKRAMAPELCFWTGNSRNRTKVLRSSQWAELDYILEGRDLFLPWAPAFAGVTRCLCQR